MPTYGYRCPACGHEFEKFQKINDNARVMCAMCGKKAERLISGGAGVLFKGSGFYETDYKRAKSEDKTKKRDTGDDKTGSRDKPSEKPSTQDAKKDAPNKGADS